MKEIIGYDANSYLLREVGYSPETIRGAVWNLINQEVKGVVLDAGSGAGGWLNKLKTLKTISKLIAVDIVDDGASQIDGVEFKILDLSEDILPCIENSVDYMFALEVLEHLANYRYFLKEAQRVLKKDGKLIVSSPCNESVLAKTTFVFKSFFPQFSETSYQFSGHITPIFEFDLKRASREAGFKNIDFFYLLPSRIPRTDIYWQNIFPFLKGKTWSDTMIAILQK